MVPGFWAGFAVSRCVQRLHDSRQLVATISALIQPRQETSQNVSCLGIHLLGFGLDDSTYCLCSPALTEWGCFPFDHGTHQVGKEMTIETSIKMSVSEQPLTAVFFNQLRCEACIGNGWSEGNHFSSDVSHRGSS